MLHRGIAAGLAVVGLCLGPAVSASTALAQEQPSAQVFQTWRTTTLGTYKSVDAYRRALDSARIRIGDAADEILGRPVFPYTRTKTVVELAVLSAAELGVESDESSWRMCTNAQGALVLNCALLRSGRSCGWTIAISRSAKLLISRWSRWPRTAETPPS